jgi:hypothetical protein
MRLAKTVALSVLVVALSGVGGTLLSAPASAQASPCPPGQPTGRPPGTPPNQPGKPAGRPPAYPPGQCSLRLSTAAGQRGQQFQATGNGFTPGEPVVFSLGGVQLQSVTADPAGVVDVSLAVPTGVAPGRTEVLASGTTRQLSAAFEVLGATEASRSAAAPAASGGVGATSASRTGLASTGAHVAMGVVAGLALIALGTVLVLTARRRRRSPLGA